uniref:Uncharacterized protein n=1 Tax=Vespula pensylvanica TaxID=30213 RepID=A0A834KVB9_VESPE|nr:hypothetical protein H0235_012736 [Vespula pensylvanica]
MLAIKEREYKNGCSHRIAQRFTEAGSFSFESLMDRCSVLQKIAPPITDRCSYFYGRKGIHKIRGILESPQYLTSTMVSVNSSALRHLTGGGREEENLRTYNTEDMSCNSPRDVHDEFGTFWNDFLQKIS